MLYQAYQLQSDLISPLRLTAQHLSASLWLRETEGSVMRKVAAACDVISRMRLTHSRPPYQIHSVTVGEHEHPVTEETVLTLPFGTLLRVTRLSTGKTIIVRINDRGPFVHGRIIDLSWGAAKKVGMMDTQPVHIYLCKALP